MRRLYTLTKNLIDWLVIAGVYWLAFLIRFDCQIDARMYQRWMYTFIPVLVLKFGLLLCFRVPQFSWRYSGLREVIRILMATGIAGAVILGVRLLFFNQDMLRYADYASVPIAVILIDFFLSFIVLAGARSVVRVWVELRENRRRLSHAGPDQAPTLLIGAGRVGLIVAKELAARPDIGIVLIGFLDDDPLKRNTFVHGLPVLGHTGEMRAVCRGKNVRQALITIANASGSDLRRIMAACEEAGLHAKTVPGVGDIVEGKVNLSRIRDVSIEDLLRRAPVVLEEQTIAEYIRGGAVLVTGAGGSIGSELCRQICSFGTSRLVLVEQAENALFEIHRELAATYPRVALVPAIADITDVKRMESIFKEHRPAMVFHAAAHKHVPMMEWNPSEAIKNNVGGTRVVADLAAAAKVCEFVMISTDKAVNPSSVMGASKRIAEIYIQALAARCATRFVTVRFGNVLGSTGSVIPIFKQQIAAGGPVTVTHPEMRRYFMTIPEACQLVLQAAVMGRGGEIFILDMGEPVRIVDLASDLIHLSGFREEDIPIKFTGVRPGEKLFEELSVSEEQADKTRHPKIFVGRCKASDWEEVLAQLDELRRLAEQNDADKVRAKIKEIVPEYEPCVVSVAQAPMPLPAGVSVTSK